MVGSTGNEVLYWHLGPCYWKALSDLMTILRVHTTQSQITFYHHILALATTLICVTYLLSLDRLENIYVLSPQYVPDLPKEMPECSQFLMG